MKLKYAVLFLLCPFLALAASTSEIQVVLKLDSLSYVVGERVRGVVDVRNISPTPVRVGGSGATDVFFVEVFRASDRRQLDCVVDAPFVSPFRLNPNEGQKLETFLGDHYGMRTASSYLARPVLVHDGLRYEGKMVAFDIVPGIRIGGALQMFANRDGLSREFDLVSWSRGGRDHLFVLSHDAGTSDRAWATWDVGPMMKITKPTVSIMSNGVVVVLHRLDPDNFIRSEFWSVPQGIRFHRRELIQDPETASSNRVRELYMESGGIKPKKNPWWKFW